MSDVESTDETYEPTHDSDYWPGEWVSRDDIEPNDWNPNEMDDEEFTQLVNSIADNGWTMPIVVHAEEQYIIDGEHRWFAASELPDDPDLTPEGVPSDHVPVYGITVAESQAKLATVQHNRARGEVQVDKLQSYLKGLNERGVLSSVSDRIGYSTDEVEELLGEIATPEIPDEDMPWDEPEVEDTGSDDDASAADDDDAASEAKIPELHHDRTMALRTADDTLDPETAEQMETVREMLTADEYEVVCQALGTEVRAQSLVNLARFIEATDAGDDVREYAAE